MFPAVGLVAGPQGVGVLQLNPGAEGLRSLAALTLASVLFADAANADFDTASLPHSCRCRLGIETRPDTETRER